MQFEFRFEPARPPDVPGAEGGPAVKRNWLQVGARRVPLLAVRHRRARRYVLRLGRDGTARVTIPRGGSIGEAKEFAARNISWLEKQLVRQALHPAGPKPWPVGTEILFRGKSVRIEHPADGVPNVVCFGSERVRIPQFASDARPAIERHLWRLAARELPARVTELAAVHQFTVRRVTVRNQRSRWGSCSRSATISLNWRLLQAPQFVCDYIILHELAHLKEMNHSRRFWREVARLCPDFSRAEKWLKEHSGVLG